MYNNKTNLVRAFKKIAFGPITMNTKHCMENTIKKKKNYLIFIKPKNTVIKSIIR